MYKPRNSDDSHARQAANRFDSWANSYGEDRISDWFRHYQQRGLEKFKFSGSERFLDVGCGPGWAVRQAGKNLPKGFAHGIDISPAMINKAKNNSAAYDNCSFQLGNAEEIPFEDNYFNALLCTFSFHHYKNPDTALSEFRRVLKASGTLVLIDSARDLSFAIWLQDRWRRYFERSHVRYYTVDELIVMITQSDLALSDPVYRETGFRKFGKTFTGLSIMVCRHNH